MNMRCFITAAVLMMPFAVHAAPLLSAKAKTQTVRHCLTKISCHTLTITRPQTGNPAIDAWAAGRLQKNWRLKGLDTAALRAALRRELKGTNTEDLGNCSGMEFSGDVGLLGQSPAYAVFAEEYYTYACGAHGNGTYALHVLPKNGAVKPVALKDIVLKGKMKRLKQLQLEAWKQYLHSQDWGEGETMTDAEIADWLKEWPFEGTDNWQISKGGLNFLFQTYEVGPYVIGRPELFIPAAKLKGIIRPGILREASRYCENHGKGRPPKSCL
ncbi:MAG: RsiV family protein [Neisseria sp.]|nr:RsiV family protein [Neisseria sp.]